MLRHAICNEVYDKWDFAQACASIRKAGYTGIEIAHFTLAPTSKRESDVSATESSSPAWAWSGVRTGQYSCSQWLRGASGLVDSILSGSNSHSHHKAKP